MKERILRMKNPYFPFCLTVHPETREIRLTHFNSFSDAGFPFPNVLPELLISMEIPQFQGHLTKNFLLDSGLIPFLSLCFLICKTCIKIIASF